MVNGDSEQLTRIVSLFNHARRYGKGYIVRCPCHEDDKPSLSLCDGNKGVLIKCMAGCNTKDILDMLNLKWSDLFYDKSNGHSAPRSNGRIVAHYRYTDAAGNLLYEVLRMKPKSFRIRRPDGNSWIYDANGVQRVLYRLPDVVKTVSEGGVVWIVEGEKDANKLAKMGLCSTCIAGGANAPWLESYSETLADSEIAILPDADNPGRDYAWRIARALIRHGCKVSIIELFPSANDGRDVSDWQGTVDELWQLYLGAKPSGILLSFAK